MTKKQLTYRDAGVDIDRQDDALDRIKAFVRATRTPGLMPSWTTERRRNAAPGPSARTPTISVTPPRSA